MAVSVGAGRLIVNVCGPLVPPTVVTVTVRGPTAAAASSTKSAVNDVLLFTTTLVTVTPLPLTFTMVPPTTKLVPVKIGRASCRERGWIWGVAVSVGASGVVGRGGG